MTLYQLRQVKGRAASVALVVILACAASTCAQQKDPPAKQLGEQKIARLITQLGDGSFDKRTAAKRELLRIGMQAKSALSLAQNHTDLEIRLRARELLARIVQNDFEQQLERLLQDDQGHQEHKLPGWQRYRAVAGHGESARRLFIDMVRHEAPLLEMIEQKSSDLPVRLRDRLNHSWPGWQTFGPTQLYGNVVSVKTPTVAVFTLACLSQPIDKESKQLVAALLLGYDKQLLFQTLDGHSCQRPMRDLIRNWITVSSEVDSDKLILLSLRFDLVDIARHHARITLRAAHAASPGGIGEATLALGQLGDAQDIAILEPHLNNEQLYTTRRISRAERSGQVRVQVRDLVLAAMLKLTGQNAKEYGFIDVGNTGLKFGTRPIGVLPAEKRPAALKRWHLWRKNNPGTPQ